MKNFRIKNRFRLFFRRTWRKLDRTFDPSKKIPELTPIQTRTVSIIRKIIKNPESTLEIGPINGVRYCEHEHYLVKFSDDTAIITNGKFSYHVSLPVITCNKLVDYFNKNIEERITKTEGRYDMNTLNNLEEILNTLS